MPGAFHGIETASRALRAFQQSLDTTGHNIANVNTKGYSRQVTQLVNTVPSQEVAGKLLNIGTGVAVNQINRIRDQFLESRRHTASGEQGKSEGNLSSLERVQSLFLDTQGVGISGSLDKFFNAWSALGADPTNTSLRYQILSAGRELTTKFSSLNAEINGLDANIGKQITQTLSDIQSKANRIAELNIEIKKNIAQGGSPNDLMDERDEAINSLAQLVDIKTHAASDGTLGVFVGNFTLVDQVGARTFPATPNAAANSVNDGNMDWAIQGGRLRGLFDSRNHLDRLSDDLDVLANTIRDQFNAVHSTGFTSTGTTGQNLFYVDPLGINSGAANFRLDAAVEADPRLLATGATANAGDGSIATALSNLRNQNVAALGNQTIGGFYRQLVAGVGLSVSNAKNSVATANALQEQVEEQIQAVAGVNMDDELANMMKFQRSYQAAAKVLSVMDETITDLIGMLRR